VSIEILFSAEITFLQLLYDREIFPITFCKDFDDIRYTYEYCRRVPESEEYLEYFETGGPDESCIFDVEQIKCLPSPITDKCPENFGTNEMVNASLILRLLVRHCLQILRHRHCLILHYHC
jgi:hypothetical protein